MLKKDIADASQLDKRDGVIADHLSFLVQKLFVKIIFAQNGYFDLFWPVES